MPRSALLFIPCCCCLFRNSDKSCCCFCCCCSYFVWVCITTPTNTNDCWHFFKWWKQWMTSSLMSTESFGLFPRKRMCEGCFFSVFFFSVFHEEGFFFRLSQYEQDLNQHDLKRCCSTSTNWFAFNWMKQKYYATTSWEMNKVCK